MKILFFDTETTGLPNMRLDPRDVGQPMIVQLAAILADEQLVEIASVAALARPEGWKIPEEAASVHGITTEKATELGLPWGLVVEAFCSMALMADVFVGHNVDFDVFLMTTAASKLGDVHAVEKIAVTPRICTMKRLTDVCKIPHPSRPGFKWPKLAEAYSEIFKRPLEGAHDALADIRATMHLFQWMRAQGLLNDLERMTDDVP